MRMKCGAHLAYLWKRCESSSPTQEIDLCSIMCAPLNAKVHGVLTMLSLMKPGKKFHAITGTFVFPPSEPSSFTIIVHSRCSACQCTTICRCDTNFIAFLYEVTHICTCIYIYIYKNNSSVSDCCCQDYLPRYA